MERQPNDTMTRQRIDAPAEWKSRLTRLIGMVILFQITSGLIIYLTPFGPLPQFSIIVHTLVGLTSLVPLVWYVIHHWNRRKKGKLSHIQLLGYIATVILATSIASGLVLTWQGAFTERMTRIWDTIHLTSGISVAVMILAHLLPMMIRKVNNPEARQRLVSARRAFYATAILGTAAGVALTFVWVSVYSEPSSQEPFAESYNWTFGDDRPFAPSLSRLDMSDWESNVRAQILLAADTASHPALNAAFNANDASEPLGILDRARTCLNDLDVSDESRAQINAVIARASDELKMEGALNARALGGSAGCGTSGCHNEIYQEWLPSAHRFSSLDELFQKVQEIMATETSPEHTRYCAGCHDPISLFSGAKNSDNITLSSVGADEGTSCLVCHSIVQADVQGNGDYTIKPARRYAYELDDSPIAKFVSDFLIRTYPTYHIASYSRPLYKTAEFCAACHKQYIDKEVNTDIGKVQGQNQYDSWKNSRWYHGDQSEQTINCRECHMPLNDSMDPARGDATDFNRNLADSKHRSHRMLASNQYIPILQQLENAEEHVALTEAWLRGEYEIPEIADRWTSGPVVRIDITVPEAVAPDSNVPIRVTLTNNKTGHDFPTGPLDMIESWVEVTVTDELGNEVFHTGGLDETGAIDNSPVVFKKDGFDRGGELIDRHNLWDLVGASYKRSMYPGVTDTFDVTFQCPSMARGRFMDNDERIAPGQRHDDVAFVAPTSETAQRLRVDVALWYRKANPEFLDRVYGVEAAVRSPATRMSESHTFITVDPDAASDSE